jgi:hypothetical protein
MSSTSGEHSDDAKQVATAQALSASREQKRRIGKRNLRHGGPLKSGTPANTPNRLNSSNSSNDKELLQQCQAIYSKLPKRSRYAQHKLKCLSKAMELLQRGRCGYAHIMNCAPAAPAASVAWLLHERLDAPCSAAAPHLHNTGSTPCFLTQQAGCTCTCIT